MDLGEVECAGGNWIQVARDFSDWLSGYYRHGVTSQKTVIAIHSAKSQSIPLFLLVNKLLQKWNTRRRICPAGQCFHVYQFPAPQKPTEAHKYPRPKKINIHICASKRENLRVLPSGPPATHSIGRAVSKRGTQYKRTLHFDSGSPVAQAVTCCLLNAGPRVQFQVTSSDEVAQQQIIPRVSSVFPC
jgi:hypothetical protein